MAGRPSPICGVALVIVLKVAVTMVGETRKELRQIFRRPASLFGLVAGPFLVLGLFLT